MLRRLAWAVLPVLALTATAAGAQTRLATTVSTNAPGSFGGSLAVLDDGVYPPNGQFYQTDTVYNYPTSTYFDFTFAGLSDVGSFNLTVDNNDDYTIDFFNGATLVTTRTIGSGQGVVGGGVETFSSDPTLTGTYLANLTLAAPVQATFARISSFRGDGAYSIGEAAFFTPAQVNGGVPEPATWAMLIMGFGLIGAAVRRGLRTSDARFDAHIRRLAAGEELA